VGVRLCRKVDFRNALYIETIQTSPTCPVDGWGNQTGRLLLLLHENGEVNTLNDEHHWDLDVSGLHGLIRYDVDNLLRSCVRALHFFLSDRDIQIIGHLFNCTSNQDYIANIERAVEFPYMSIKRSLNKLQEIGAIEGDRSDHSYFCYYRLTKFGSDIGKILILSTDDVDSAEFTDQSDVFNTCERKW